ncbi:TPM domain-containing protein [Spirulina subsalsa]|uniref:TPM domain-containing protein n=1 Tax=Spirulina subsalsa TaxID=54311 RepID=UPI0002DEC81D|nr:TPM domain-containing protein [Spirulina subsalsa]
MIYPKIKLKNQPKVRTFLLGALIFVCLSFTLLLHPAPSYAVTPAQVPNPRQVSGGWVTDMANVIDSATEAQLNQIITELEAKNGAEIAVVTIPQTNELLTPKDFATQLFNLWGIGKVGQDNGILFLTSVGDRRVEIETGYGIEGILPDGRVGRILDDHVVPYFRNDDFNQGILEGTKALIEVLESQTFDPALVPSLELPNFVWLMTGFTAILSGVLYNISQGFSRKPVLVNPGEYKRIKGVDGSDFSIYLFMRAGVFCVLFAVTILPIFTLSHRSPELALFGGVLLVTVIFLFFTYKAAVSTKKLNQRLRTWTILLGLIILGTLIIVVPGIVDLRFLWEAIALVLLMTITPRNDRLLSAVTSIIISFFVTLILVFFWVLLNLEQWGYMRGIVELFLDYFSHLTVSGFAAAIISLFGCFPVARELIQWRFQKSENQRSLRPIYNANSQSPMQLLNSEMLLSVLNQHQKKAQQLDSTFFEGWWTPKNHSVRREEVYLKAYINTGLGQKYSECPIGKEFTVSSTSTTVISATEHSTGLERIIDTCECCSYRKQSERVIPRVTSSSSSSSSSSSGGGGSFGGGSSGGGGAGRGF